MGLNNFFKNKLLKSFYIIFLNSIFVIVFPIKKLNAFLEKIRTYRFIKFFFFKKNQFIINKIESINFFISTNDWVNSRKIYTNQSFPQLDQFSTAISILKNDGVQVDSLIDIGAHYGNIVIPAMIKYNFKEAYAFEPIQENFNILRSNLIFNNLEHKVKAYNVFLSNHIEELEINTFQNNTAAATILNKLNTEKKDKYIKINNLKNQSFEKVRVDTLDNILSNSSNCFFWIYAQGGELNIIRGSKQVLKNSPPLVIAYSSVLFDDKKVNYLKELNDVLNQIGYKQFRNLSQKNYYLQNLNFDNLKTLDKKLRNNGSTNFLLIT